MTPRFAARESSFRGPFLYLPRRYHPRSSDLILSKKPRQCAAFSLVLDVGQDLLRVLIPGQLEVRSVALAPVTAPLDGHAQFARGTLPRRGHALPRGPVLPRNLTVDRRVRIERVTRQVPAVQGPAFTSCNQCALLSLAPHAAMQPKIFGAELKRAPGYAHEVGMHPFEAPFRPRAERKLFAYFQAFFMAMLSAFFDGRFPFAFFQAFFISARATDFLNFFFFIICSNCFNMLQDICSRCAPLESGHDFAPERK